MSKTDQSGSEMDEAKLVSDPFRGPDMERKVVANCKGDNPYVESLVNVGGRTLKQVGRRISFFLNHFLCLF